MDDERTFVEVAEAERQRAVNAAALAGAVTHAFTAIAGAIRNAGVTAAKFAEGFAKLREALAASSATENEEDE